MFGSLLTKLQDLLKIRKRFLCKTGILLVVVLLFQVYLQFQSEEKLNNVVASMWYEEKFYGIDSFQNTNTVFVCDLDGKNSQSITFESLISNSYTNRIGESIFIGEDGRCYVTYQEYSQMETPQFKMAVANFKEEIFEEIKEIPTPKPPALGRYQSQKFSDGTTLYVDVNGSVWKQKGNETETAFFLNNGKIIDTANTAYCFGNYSLFFYNIKNNILYQIPYDTGQLEESSLEISKNNGDLYQLSQMEDGTFVATFREADTNRLLPVVYKDGTSKIEKISPSLKEKVKEVMGDTFVCLGYILVFYALYRGVLYIFGGVVPTALKLFFCVGLAIVVANQSPTKMVLMGVSDRIQTKEELRLYYDTETLAVGIRQWISAIPKEQVGQQFVQELKDYADKILEPGEIHDVKNNSKEKIEISQMNYQLLVNYQGDFHLAETNPLYCVPSTYAYGIKESEYMKECERTGEIIVFNKTEPYNGEKVVLYRPIVDQDGLVSAIIVGELDKAIIIEEAKEYKSKIVMSIYIFFGAMLLIFIMVASIVMWPLIKLIRLTEDVEKGMEITFRKKSGVSEITVISRFFIAMLERIDIHLKKVDRLKQAYEPFVPENIVHLFGGKDVIDINLGETTKVNAVIAVIESDELGQKQVWKDASSKLGALNQMYSILYENIEAVGGIVESFTAAGAIIIFPNRESQKEIKEVLFALGRATEDLNAAKLGYEEIICYFGAGVTVGELKLGVIGTNDRMEVMAVSSYTRREATCLNQISYRYKAGILLTKQVVQKVLQAGERDSIRLFGYPDMKMGISHATKEEIFEFFLPLGREQSQLRAITRNDYETGIQYLRESQYLEARGCFERVLRRNQNDLAVKHLFRLCDKRLEIQ